ncbi:hypothetical protein ACTI_36080 [Actinoplanes sp. OR16]|nr:hypothetical protein ACTI_36080 [Actinoplanes sp. OR16]
MLETAALEVTALEPAAWGAGPGPGTGLSPEAVVLAMLVSPRLFRIRHVVEPCAAEEDAAVTPRYAGRVQSFPTPHPAGTVGGSAARHRGSGAASDGLPCADPGPRKPRSHV